MFVFKADNEREDMVEDDGVREGGRLNVGLRGGSPTEDGVLRCVMGEGVRVRLGGRDLLKDDCYKQSLHQPRSTDRKSI